MASQTKLTTVDWQHRESARASLLVGLAVGEVALLVEEVVH
jgi:hypothetical protein